MKGKGKEKEKGSTTKINKKIVHKRKFKESNMKESNNIRQVDLFTHNTNILIPEIKPSKVEPEENFIYNKAPIDLIQKKHSKAFKIKDTEEDESIKKRKKLIKEKKKKEQDAPEIMKAIEDKFDESNLQVIGDRIQPLVIRRGNLILSSILEERQKYFICSFTRNKKGYISKEEFSKFSILRFPKSISDLVQLTIFSPEGPINPELLHNRKFQVSVGPHVFNSSLSIRNIAQNIIIPGVISEVEDKAIIIDIGFSDKSIGIIKIDNKNKNSTYTIGTYITVIIDSFDIKSKVIQLIDVANISNLEENLVKNDGQITFDSLKPGYLVQARVKSILSNGILVTFFKSFEGTVFEDHLLGPKSNYTINMKLKLRIILVDISKQWISLSEKDHIIKLKPYKFPSSIQICNEYTNAEVVRKVFGNSYLVKLEDNKMQMDEAPIGFLHSKNIDENNKDEEVKEFQKVIIKELNYFDGIPILSTENENIKAKLITWDNLNIGDLIKGEVMEIKENEFVKVKINSFVSGIIPIHHLVEYKFTKIPTKFQKGNKISARIFFIDKIAKYLILTRRKKFIKIMMNHEEYPIVKSKREEYKFRDAFIGIICHINETRVIAKTIGNISAVFSLVEKNEEETTFENGDIVDFIVAFNDPLKQKIGLSLNMKSAERIASKFNKLSKSLNSIYIDLPFNLNEGINFSKSISPGKEYDFKIKINLIGSKEINSENFLVLQSIHTPHFYGILPKFMISNFPDINDMLFEFYKANEGLTIKALVLGTEQISHTLLLTTNSLLIQFNNLKQIPFTIKELIENEIKYGFISKVTEKGVEIRMLSNLKGFVPKSKMEFQTNFFSTLEIGQFAKFKVIESNQSEKKYIFSMRYSDLYGLKSGNVTSKIKNIVNKELMDKLKYYYESFLYLNTQFKENDNSLQLLKLGDSIKCQYEYKKEYGLIFKISDFGLIGLLPACCAENLILIEGNFYDLTIIDINPVKRILTLYHPRKINEHKESIEINDFSKDNFIKGKVIYLKSQFAYLSFNNDVQPIGIIPLNLLNSDEKIPNIETFLNQFIQVKVFEKHDNLLLCIPEISNISNIWKNPKLETEEKIGRKRSFSIDIGNLTNGQTLTGKVSNKKLNTIYVYFNRNLIGKLHKSQFENSESFENHSKGAFSTSKILAVYDILNSNKKTIELSLLENKNENVQKGEKIQGVIKSIHWNTSFPLKIELSSSIIASIHFTNITLNRGDFENKRLDFREGDIIECYSLTDFSYKDPSCFRDCIKLSLFPLIEKNPINKGNLILCRTIVPLRGRGLIVDLGNNETGFVDITEISDDYLADPLNLLNEKSIFVGRVFDINSESLRKILISTRHSMVNQESYDLIFEGGSLQFQSRYVGLEQVGDIRNKINRLGYEWINPGQLMCGYISNINSKGCFIKIASKLTVRSSLKDLSDNQIENAFQSFPIGKLCLVRAVSIKMSNIKSKSMINVSLRESVILTPITLNIKNLKKGTIVSCKVISQNSNYYICQIIGSQFKSHTKVSQLSLANGSSFEGEIIKINKHQKPFKIEVAFRKVIELKKDKFLLDLFFSIKRISESIKYEVPNEAPIITVNDTFPENINENEKIEKDINDLQLADIENSGSEDELISKLIKESFPEGENLLEKEDSKEDSKEGSEPELEPEGEDINNAESLEETNNMKDEEDDNLIDSPENLKDLKSLKNQNQSKNLKLKERVDEEKKIRKKEFESSRNEEAYTIEDFEKLVTTSPNDSIQWIKYASFLLDNAGIESSRNLFERALKNNSLLSDEKEKLNLWIAYMNLENSFGSFENLQQLSVRAIECNDPKKIHISLSQIFVEGKKYKYALDLFKVLIKKYHNDLDIWKLYFEFIFILYNYKKSSFVKDVEIPSHEIIHPSEALLRATQSISKDKLKQLKSIVSSCAYNSNQLEYGRTLMEEIISEDLEKSKLDSWSRYLDLEIKNGSISIARSLFERALNTKIKNKKKMKFVFKRYLEFEQNFGTPDKVEKVIEMAKKYVEENIPTEKGNEQNDDK